MATKIIKSFGVTVTFDDNSEEILRAMENALHRGLEAIGMKAEDYAKRDAKMPVDTGLARNSITHAVTGYPAAIQTYKADRPRKGEDAPREGSYNGNMEGEKDEAVVIGSGVEYFPFIEDGTKKMKARHVLRRAATEHSDEYKNLMKQSFENA